jgi:hypothetical protein
MNCTLPRITFRRENENVRIEGHLMANEPTSRPARATAPAVAGKPPPASGARVLAITTAIVFFLSSVFPVVAGFVKDRDSWPKWWGVLDVCIAFVLAILVLAITALAHGKMNKQAEDASYRAYRVLIHGIFALLVVFFLFGDRIVWGNCLTGFAWRFWLLLYGLPAWLSLFGAPLAFSGFLEKPVQGVG